MKRLLVVLAVAALLSSGCGGTDPAENPGKALQTALENLAAAEGSTFVFSILSDAESLVAASENSLKVEDAEKVLDSSLQISGTRAQETADQRALMVLNLAGRDSVEFRQVGNDLYVRADVPHIAELFGQDPASVEQAAEQAPPGFEWARDAVAGEWLHLTGGVEMLEQFTGQAAARDKKFIDGLTAALKKSATVRAAGEDDAGTRLVVTIPLRSLYREVSETLTALQAIPGAQLPPENEVPNKDFQFEVWVDGDTLTQAQVDFVRIAREFEEDAPANVEQLGVRVRIEEFDGEVDEPEDAVEVDARQIVQNMLGGLGGAPTGGAPTGIQCDQFAGADKEVLESLRAELEPACPELYP